MKSTTVLNVLGEAIKARRPQIAVASAKTNLVSLLRVISLSHCHFRGVCTLPGRQIPDEGKHSQFHWNYNQSGYKLGFTLLKGNFAVKTYQSIFLTKYFDVIGGQIRAHFFKSMHKSAKCAVGRKIAHFFDVL